MAKRFDFTETNELIELVYGNDVFRVTGIAPADTITDLAVLSDAQSNADKVNGVKQFLTQVLVPEDLDRYLARLKDSANPIGFGALLKTFETLMEVYTDSARPTEGPSGSPDGFSTTGPSSTGSVASEVLGTHAASVLPAS